MVHPTDAKWYNEQVELGYNYRMTDFQAALLLSQLDKLDRFIERRTQIVKRYNEAFAECPGACAAAGDPGVKDGTPFVCHSVKP